MIEYNTNNGFLDNPPGEQAGGSAAAGGSLVTNTVLSPPKTEKNALQPPSLLAFHKMGEVSKRYVLHGALRQLLETTKFTDDGEKSKFYRLGACRCLSAHFRPENFRKGDIDYLTPDCPTTPLANISYQKNEDGTIKAHLAGFVHCDSNWLCPLCAPILSEYRAKEIYAALYHHQKGMDRLVRDGKKTRLTDDGAEYCPMVHPVKGGYVCFVTFTLQHYKNYQLSRTLQVLTGTLGRLKKGKAWDTMKAKYGFVGSIRALEYTYTERHGHHPHVHELWFFDKRPAVGKLKKEVYNRYARYVEKFSPEGFHAPSYKRGVDIKLCLSSDQKKKNLLDDGLDLNDIEKIAKYCAKGAETDKTLEDAVDNRTWGVSEELTKHQLKVNKVRRYSDGGEIVSYNSTAMLLNYVACQYVIDECILSPVDRRKWLKKLARFKALYTDYANSFFGKSLNYWSPGLKDRFQIHEFSDNEVSKAFEGEMCFLMGLGLDRIQFMLKNRLRGRLLDVVNNPELKTDQQRMEAVDEFLSVTQERYRFG
ncbi:protein rep [Kistimonas asteriae]|uniref:protein rep n=1 Tax=Kistimonas asteriae TaxID=517724 RepID=UPI001BAC88A7|nr:protein rep [Kistimonas asteriae]